MEKHGKCTKKGIENNKKKHLESNKKKEEEKKVSNKYGGETGKGLGKYLESVGRILEKVLGMNWENTTKVLRNYWAGRGGGSVPNMQP